MSNPWIQHVKSYAARKGLPYNRALQSQECRRLYRAQMSGGALDEKELIQEMCKVNEPHYDYWCQICDQETYDPIVDFSTAPEAQKTVEGHPFLKTSLNKRRYICKKCKTPENKFWEWETCEL